MVLFVCTGNTCRSPMAEGYTRFLLERSGRRDIEVMSAGTFAGYGCPASPESVQALAAVGADISGHCSRPLTPELIDQADLIVAMTAAHRRAIGAVRPAATRKTRLLLEYDDRPGDVADPIGGDTDVYAACFAEMKRALDNLFLELARKDNPGH